MVHLLACGVMASLTVASSFEYKDKFACAVCNDLVDLHANDPSTVHCERYGSCHVVNEKTIAEGCASFCPSPVKFNSIAGSLDLRVAKGFGTRPYPSLRVSVITKDGSAPVLDGKPFDYSESFKYKWTGNQLHSSIIEVSPGQNATVKIGTETINLRLPAQGAGAAGVLIADPCVSGSEVGCTYEKKFQTTKRIAPLLNAFVGGSNATDYWGIFGDNFYGECSWSRCRWAQLTATPRSTGRRDAVRV
jgi:hypothetical protein